MQPLPPIINHDDPLRPYTPPPKPKKKGWEKAKKILIVFTLSSVIAFSLLVIVVGIMEDKIGAMVVKEANKQLKTKLTVQNFSISLISGFPRASAQLEGVNMKDVFGGQLLKARILALEFSLFNLFSDNITISSVVIKDGVLVLKTDVAGRNNFDIIKPSKDKANSNLTLSVEKAKLQNVRFIYSHLPNRQSADLMLKSAFASGNFGSKNFTLSSKSDINIAYVENNGQKYLTNKPLSYNAHIAVDMVQNIYKFDNLAVNVASIPLQANGLVQLVPQKGTFFNLIMNNSEGSLANLFQLLPPQYSAYFKDFQSSGQFNFKATVKGLSNKTQTPYVSAIVHFKNGKINSPKLKQSLEKVSFDAEFDNKKDILEITNCHAAFAGNPLEMNLKVINLKDPSVSFGMNGAMPLSMAFGLLNNAKVTDGAGMVRCNGLQITGKYADMKGVQALQSIKASGELALENATLKVNNEPIAANGVLDFNNNAISVNKFNIIGAGSNATFTGVFTNWLPVLLSDSTKQTDLEVDARLDAEILDIGKIIALARPQPQRVVPQSYYYAAKGLPMPQYRKRFPILNRMKGRFESNIKNFVYNKINGRSFKGNIDFTGNDLLLRGSAVAMGGSWLLDGKMELNYRPHLFTKLTTEKVDISEFFRECENFGQTVLKNNNITGKLTSRMAINAYWDEGFNFLMDKLHVLSDVNIHDGELVGLKLLESFSTYIRVEDLKRVKFSNLQNQLEIYKQSIHIPVMYIQSNALNMQISGNHSFNQDINYNIVVNAAQVLMNRLKLNPRIEQQPEQRNGLFNLYYNISGNINNFKYSSDKSGVKEAFADSEGRKNLIISELTRIFGSNIQNIVSPMNDNAAKPNVPTARPQSSIATPRKNIDGLFQSLKKTNTKNKENNEPEYLPGF